MFIQGLCGPVFHTFHDLGSCQTFRCLLVWEVENKVWRPLYICACLSLWLRHLCAFAFLGMVSHLLASMCISVLGLFPNWLTAALWLWACLPLSNYPSFWFCLWCFGYTHSLVWIESSDLVFPSMASEFCVVRFMIFIDLNDWGDSMFSSNSFMISFPLQLPFAAPFFFSYCAVKVHF